MPNSSFLSVHAIGLERNSLSVLNNITFTMDAEQRVVIAGETGSGKSTLLKIISGLEQPTSGIVRLNGNLVKGPADQLVPGHSQIAYLSQHFELPKFLRVEQVLEYANKLSQAKANKIFSICRINKLLQRKTHELSGGEKQRIAIARLLIQKPQLLLLDEPFSHLDIALKKTLKQVVDDIGAKLKISCILVSHDPDDTLPWADKIIVLKDGQVVQQGTPKSIYQFPSNEYVAGLFGHYTLIDHTLIKKLRIETKTKKIILRPEELRIVQKGTKSISGVIADIQYYGQFSLLTVASNRRTFVVNIQDKNLTVGQRVQVAFKQRRKV